MYKSFPFSSADTAVSNSLLEARVKRVHPFDITTAGETPNEETRRALAAAEAKERGLILDDAPAFDNVDKLMTFLEKE